MGRPSWRGSNPAGGHGRWGWGWGSKLGKGEKENLVQIDIINLDLKLQESDVRLFILNTFKQYTLEKFPSVMESLMQMGASGLIARTSKLNSGYMSFLPRRWVLEIGYL